MTFGLTFNLGVHLGVKVILQVHCIAAHLQEKMTHTISCLFMFMFMFISKKSKGGVHLQSAFKLKLTEKIKHSFLSSCKGARKILLSVCFFVKEGGGIPKIKNFVFLPFSLHC